MGVVVQLLSCIQLFATLWPAAHQVSLSFTISQSLLKLMFIESVITSNHLMSTESVMTSNQLNWLLLSKYKAYHYLYLRRQVFCCTLGSLDCASWLPPLTGRQAFLLLPESKLLRQRPSINSSTQYSWLCKRLLLQGFHTLCKTCIRSGF